MINKFGFILRSNNIDKRWISQPFFHETYAKTIWLCYEPTYAKERFSKIFVREPLLDIWTNNTIYIPLIDWWTKITKEFIDYIVSMVLKKAISDEVKEWLFLVNKYYDCYESDWIVWFVKREWIDIKDYKKQIKIMMMKSTILNFHRFHPLKINIDWKHHNLYMMTHFINKKEQAKVKAIAEDIRINNKVYWINYQDEITIEHNGVLKSTPIRWQYTIDFIESMFENAGKLKNADPEKLKYPWIWKLLTAQREFILNLTQRNYLIACRWWWKWYIEQLLMWLQVYSEDSDGKWLRWENNAMFFWPSLPNASEALRRFNDNLTNGKLSILSWSIKPSAENGKVNILYDSENTKKYSFASFDTFNGKNLGRWMRSNMTFFDENAHADDKQDEAVRSSINTHIDKWWIWVFASTLNDKVTDNKFTTEWLKSAMISRTYRPVEDDILDIRFWFWLDKITFDDIYWSWYDKTMELFKSARLEFFARRPIFWGIYDIFTSEHTDEREIKTALNITSEKSWENIQAEQLCRVSFSWKLLDPKGSVIPQNEIPQTFDDVMLSYDVWWAYDKWWYCVIWWNEDWMFVIESWELISNRMQQYYQIAAKLSELHEKYPRRVQCIIDQWWQDEFTLNDALKKYWIEDFIFCYSHAGDKIWYNKDWRFNFGKKEWTYVVKNSIDFWIVKIWTDNQDLIKQMSNWTEAKLASWATTHKWKGSSKDDICTAMIMWIVFMAHEEWLWYSKVWLKHVNEDSISRKPTYEELETKYWESLNFQWMLYKYGYTLKDNNYEETWEIGYEDYKKPSVMR